jgi:hypothetical protein
MLDVPLIVPPREAPACRSTRACTGATTGASSKATGPRTITRSRAKGHSQCWISLFRGQTVVGDRDNGAVSDFNFFEAILADTPKAPTKVSSRTFRSAIEEALIHTYTRSDLETVFAEEFRLPWPETEQQPTDAGYSKRDVIKTYTAGWDLSRLVALARRIVAELEITDMLLADLTALLAEYDRGGGVGTPAKNLIFAANGPKPELVLRDAVNNDIEIVRNGKYCLVYDQPIPADGLTFSNLIEWWREHEGFADTIPARDVGLKGNLAS